MLSDSQTYPTCTQKFMRIGRAVAEEFNYVKCEPRILYILDLHRCHILLVSLCTRPLRPGRLINAWTCDRLFVVLLLSYVCGWFSWRHNTVNLARHNSAVLMFTQAPVSRPKPRLGLFRTLMFVGSVILSHASRLFFTLYSPMGEKRLTPDE